MRFRRVPVLFTALIASATVLAGCAGAPEAETSSSGSGSVSAAAFPLTLDSCGFSTQIKAKPERAVTLNQGATEIALALGVEKQLAGTAYLDDKIAPQWEVAYKEVPVLAPEYPDKETLLAAKPDLVIASYASAFDEEAIGSQQSLTDAGIASYLSPFGCADKTKRPAVSFDSVWAEISSVATAFGVPEKGAEIKRTQQNELSRLTTEKSGAGKKVFWYDSGDKTPTAGTGQGGPQVILDAVGATNVFKDVAGGWGDVSWEKVIAADPDVIVLADASWSTAQQKITHLQKDPALAKLRAVQAKSFVTVPFSESTTGVRLIDGATAVGKQLAAQK